MYGRRPEIVPLEARSALKVAESVRSPLTRFAKGEPPSPTGGEGKPQAMLLIGDKVVTASPPATDYPHQLDLGEAWKTLTGLPFVPLSTPKILAPPPTSLPLPTTTDELIRPSTITAPVVPALKLT